MRIITGFLTKLVARRDLDAQLKALGPKPEGFDRAVLAFRAAGGSSSELLIFARITARGRVTAEDRAVLGRAGISLRAGSGE